MTPLARILSWLDPRRSAQRKESPASPRVVFQGSAGAPFPLLQHLLDSYAAPAPPPILLFGDSVMERVSRNDTSKLTLGEMIAQHCEVPVCIASRSAFQPSLALALLRVARRLHRPKVVVVPVNLRCFSPQWDFNPAWSFHQELAAIEGWLGDDRQPPAAIADVVEPGDFYDAFDHIPVDTTLSTLRTVGAFRAAIRDRSADTEATQKREILVFHYGTTLSAGHRKLTELRACVSLLREMGIAPVVYLTPLNIDACRKAVGDDLLDAIAVNVATVSAGVVASGGEAVDLTCSLGADMFFHEDFATEHLNEKGRSRLAGNIAALIREALKSRS